MGLVPKLVLVKIPLHELLIEHRKVMEDDLNMHHDGSFVNFEMNTIGRGTSCPALFGMAINMAHTGLNVLPKAKEVTVEGSIFEYGAVRKAPALAKGGRMCAIYNCPSAQRSIPSVV